MKKTLCIVSALLSLAVFANEDGSVSLDYNNDVTHVITGSSGATFKTRWSVCGKGLIYAYNTYVKLVGFGSSLTSFPADPFEFTKLDWELRAPPIAEGSYVVFMNTAGQFLCVHVTNAKSWQYDGTSTDKVAFEYRIYDDAQSTADVVREKHELAKQNYRAVGKDSGSATFHYEYNTGIFEIEGATGQYFKSYWSGGNTDMMYVYRDYVKAIAPGHYSWTSFPSSTDGFSSLDWSQRVPRICTGEYVVLQNSEGQYLVCRISEVRIHSENKADDYVSFDYRIYGTGTKPPFDDSDTAPLATVASDTVTFSYSANGGCYTIGTTSTGQFVTKWSTAGRETLRAYRDKVKLLGVYSGCTAFPATRADLLRFDWECRYDKIPEGGYVAFLNASGQILCARIKNIQSKSWGAAADSLTLEYRIYAADETLWSKIVGAWTGAQAFYRTTGNTGTASFRYTCNGGKFSVFGTQGEAFETKWSSCSATSVYAYRDNVASIASGDSWTDFPSSAAVFAGLDWSSRAATVREGGWVVFRNAAGGFLCAKVKDVRAVDRGDTQDLLIFDYRIYSPDNTVPAATPSNALATVDLSSDDPVSLPVPTDNETFDVKLVKTVTTSAGTRRVDLSDCLNVPRLDNGCLDLSNAEVRPEIAAEVLDPNQGAKLDFSNGKVSIETANTRDGLTYEFYEATSLDGLRAKAKETKAGDGKPFKPTSALGGASSAFFCIGVKK